MILELGIILGLMAVAGAKKKKLPTSSPAGDTAPPSTTGGPGPEPLPTVPTTPPTPFYPQVGQSNPKGGPAPITPARKGIRTEQITEGGRTVRELVSGNKVLQVYSSQRTDAAGNPITTSGHGGTTTSKPVIKKPSMV